jgi:hypothetical protein
LFSLARMLAPRGPVGQIGRCGGSQDDSQGRRWDGGTKCHSRLDEGGSLRSPVTQRTKAFGLGTVPIFQTSQPFFDQCFADALPLMLRQNGNRSQSIPVRCAVGDGHGRESNVPHHSAIHLCDQRYGTSLSGTQRLDDELLRVAADLQGLERCDRHLSDRANIVMRLVPDHDVAVYGLTFLSLPGQPVTMAMESPSLSLRGHTGHRIAGARQTGRLGMAASGKAAAPVPSITVAIRTRHESAAAHAAARSISISAGAGDSADSGSVGSDPAGGAAQAQTRMTGTAAATHRTGCRSTGSSQEVRA